MIGLSGGPDSVCLFHVLKSLEEELDICLYAVHVNHKFRPGAAEEDQGYVEKLCQSQGVPCRVVVRDCAKLAQEQGMSSEEAGRKVRYQAFEEMCRSLADRGIAREAIKIAVAQNADDQAETVLLRLLRGTGPDGLAGMAYLRREGDFAVIRPLLDMKRQQIEAYCREHKLDPRIDQTNLQSIYTRNKVRLQLIPYLKEHFNSSVDSALVRLSKIAAEDKEYLWKITEQSYKELMIEPGILNLAGLQSLEKAIRRRVMLNAFEEAGLEQDITARHLEAADQLLMEGGTSKSLDFPGGCKMTIGYGCVSFRKEIDQTAARAKTRLKMRLAAAEEEFPPGAAVFDWEKICEGHGASPQVQLRTRLPGDYIGLKLGRKKIQDFFVDKKVPKEERDRVPLAAIGSEILWMVADGRTNLKAHRYSEKYKVDQATKVVLLLEIICEI